MCENLLEGRSDKKFCSVKCKKDYHSKLRASTNKAVKDINKLLQRNRSILLEIQGKHKSQVTVDRKVLEYKKFTFKYHTHYHINKQGKTYHYVYDFSWMEFSNDRVLITRK